MHFVFTTYTMHCTLSSNTTDIWWPTLETCSNLFTRGPSPSSHIWWWPLKQVWFASGWYASYWNAFFTTHKWSLGQGNVFTPVCQSFCPLGASASGSRGRLPLGLGGVSGGFRGGAPGTRPPHGPKFSQFHAVFRKIWQNHMLATPLEGWRPLLRGILGRPWVSTSGSGGVHPPGHTLREHPPRHIYAR